MLIDRYCNSIGSSIQLQNNKAHFVANRLHSFRSGVVMSFIIIISQIYAFVVEFSIAPRHRTIRFNTIPHMGRCVHELREQFKAIDVA